MKELPKSVMVGGFRLKVEIVERVDKDNSTGEMSTEKGHILIREGIGEQSWQIFFHEVFHAIDEVYNRSSLSEKSIDQMAQGMYQVAVEMGWLDENGKKKRK